MSVFPIHIIELLTVALVLLAAYRVFQAQSSESKCQANVIPQRPEKELRSPEGNDADLIEPILSDNLGHTSREQTKNKENTAVCHQTVLNNYIGDFF